MLSEYVFSVAPVLDQGVLVLLMILSIISVGIIIERWMTIGRAYSYSLKVRQKICAAIDSQQMDDVENLSKDLETIEGRAISTSLRHMKEMGSLGLQELFNGLAFRERGELEKSLNFLATIGSNAPYIGLLGTVFGIMKAFHDLSTIVPGGGGGLGGSGTQAGGLVGVMGSTGQQAAMAGISMALVATALGLFVAIPAVMFYNLFLKRVKRIMDNLTVIREFCMIYARRKGI